MPNHVTNRLTLHCDAATASQVFAEIGGKDDDGSVMPIDFNTLIPYPKAFAEADRACDAWRKQNPEKPTDQGPNDGYNHGGYEWCNKHWGTKWNAYAQKRLGDTAIRFDTAWTTPQPVFEALSAKYPTVAFTVEYADEDLGRNAGKLHYRGGEQGCAELSGSEAVALWFDLHPDGDPNEYGYDPETFAFVGEEAA
jgi:hypothetical protein